jgi:nicotinamide phosphoribosyltransferase
MKNNLIANLILNSDSYKYSQPRQWAPDIKYVSSYIEARKSDAPTVFFGLQMFIKEYLLTPFTRADIIEAEMIILAHGLPFYRDDWEHIYLMHKGFLPLRIQAVPEGTVMESSNVQVQIVNTDPACYWLPSFIETAILRGVWYPSTVATVSRNMKLHIANALEITSDVPVADQIQFKLHDFGARGATCLEQAMLGGTAHLVNFMGTDTVSGLLGARHYYGEDMAGFSIPASEHSTMTSWGRDGEAAAFKNMLTLFSGDGKLLAIVSDSYDIYNATRQIIGRDLRDEIINSGGTLVVRPDSGSPTIVPIEVIKILMDKFGYTTNSKGYKLLPPYIRVIQGDGIDSTSLPKLLDNLEMQGISAENIAFGMGGGLLQNVSRDTFGYAMKASAVDKGKGWEDTWKDPIHGGKTSKRGRLAYNGSQTFREDELKEGEVNLLEDVFLNGELLRDTLFSEVRKNAAI